MAMTKTVAESRSPPTQKLHKLLAQAGLGSRREMETLIAAGRVSVNGKPAGVGERVSGEDTVRVDKRIVRFKSAHRLPRVLLYHKPENEIVSRDDPEGRASVFDNLPPIRGAKWIAIGRLDYNSCGLLMFTTSGELANLFMHPRFEVEREYAVRILGELTPEHFRQLLGGVQLEDGEAKFASLFEQGGEATNRWYHVVLQEGRKRLVRRMFEALGFTVSRLMRVRFGPVVLPPRLKRCALRELETQEVQELLVWAGMRTTNSGTKSKAEARTEARPTGASPIFAPSSREQRLIAKPTRGRPQAGRRSR
ncbi:MAG: pseudouridine synthase [Pseudomonadota bacterium]|nr:pseudouridine synthase [Pseudomonadota bacterium]